MRSSRKGMVLYYIVVPGFVLALVYFLILTVYTQPAKVAFPGEIHSVVLAAPKVAENVFVYADSATKLAAPHVVLELASRGGFAEESRCGVYFGYSLFGADCMPNLARNFEQLFTRRMNPLIVQYPDNGKVTGVTLNGSLVPRIVEGHYKLFLGKGVVAGVSDRSVEVGLYRSPVPEATTPRLGLYTIPLQFRANIDYDFGILHTITERLTRLVERVKESKDPWDDIKNFALQSKEPAIQPHACAPENAAELFYQIAEALEQCITSTSTATCRCDIPREGLALLGGEYDILLTQKERKANLRLYQKRENKKEEYTTEEPARLAYYSPQKKYTEAESVPVSTAALSWNNGLHVTFLDSGEKVVLTQPLSLLRSSSENSPTVAFVPDSARTEDYEHVPLCSVGGIKKVRLCVDAGSISVYNTEQHRKEEKKVQVKVALDVGG